MTTRTKIILAAAALAAGLPSAHATFVLVDNFDSYTAGANGTEAGWAAGFSGGSGASTTTTIDVSALAGSDQGTIFTYGGSGGQINSLSLGTVAAEGATGTLFFQIGMSATGSDTLFSLGRSGAAAYGDLASLGRVVSSGLAIQVHNGSYVATGSTAALNTVYNVWMVADNSANTWSLYMSTGSDAAALVQSSIAFRSTTAGDLNTLYIGTNSGSALVIDNIHIDSTGANFSMPAAVPEPHTVALLAGLGVLGFAALRRRAARR